MGMGSAARQNTRHNTSRQFARGLIDLLHNAHRHPGLNIGPTDIIRHGDAALHYSGAGEDSYAD